MLKITIFSIPLLLGLFLISCNKSKITEEEINKQLSLLKNNEARAIFEVNDTLFYVSNSVFTGEVDVTPQKIFTELKDQYNSHIVLNLPVERGFKNSNFNVASGTINEFNTNLMIGKIIDIKENLGNGNVLTAGVIKIKEISFEKLIIEIDGKVGRYYSGIEILNYGKTLEEF
ncbi:MAG: hypothetical protein U5N85_17155 [Arcicella sp.]|nr:hypothetical protein [Arcicella sp.]